MKKAWAAALLVGAYLATFLIINIIHFRFLPVGVVLYDTVVDAVATGVLFLAIVVALRHRLPLSGLEMTLSVLLGLALAGGYAISVPTVIDRSLSMYILEKLAQRGGAIRQDAFEGIFVNEYMKEHRLVDIRLTEQLESGTIAIRDGCVVLTERGQRIAGITRFYRTNLLPKRRKIMGVYTDDLTDPFRNSAPATYACDPGAAAPAKTK
ncbi:hypothetical protein ABIE41_000580 [Bosea sp. OAE506]|uniref:hypothetical protein n=1 Tax=Bosea sp. OAE506 TaxID=2663870 RepID=UPI00178A05F9